MERARERGKGGGKEEARLHEVLVRIVGGRRSCKIDVRGVKLHMDSAALCGRGASGNKQGTGMDMIACIDKWRERKRWGGTAGILTTLDTHRCGRFRGPFARSARCVETRHPAAKDEAELKR